MNPSGGGHGDGGGDRGDDGDKKNSVKKLYHGQAGSRTQSNLKLEVR